MNKKHAFSLIELSIVILIIGILIAGITQGSRLVSRMKLATAQQLTQSAPTSSITNLVLWLETTSENSFATGTSGTYTTISEPENNTALGSWNDSNPQSISKINATQSTGANQPVYIASSINGLPVVRFTSSASSKFSAAINLNYNVVPNVTIFAVYKRIGSAPDQCILGQDNTNWDRFICVQHSQNGGNASTSNGTQHVTITNGNTLNPTIISLVLQSTVTNGSNAYINGSLAATLTETHSNAGDNSLSIGVIGSSAFSTYYDGDLGEIIIFDRALKTEERKSIEKYLGQKWGIKVS